MEMKRDASMAREEKTPRERRTVTISISAPVTVTLTVERAADAHEEDSWEVTGIRRADCDLSARGATECMSEEDFAELDRLANAAQNDGATGASS
jgi:hypothetical protein